MTVAAMQMAGHEGVRASVVAGVDAAPVLEPSEHDLDPAALAIERGIVRDRYLPVCLRGDAGGDLAVGQGGTKPVSIVALVAEQGLRPGAGHRS
jgi:hypothetical protein